MRRESHHLHWDLEGGGEAKTAYEIEMIIIYFLNSFLLLVFVLIIFQGS